MKKALGILAALLVIFIAALMMFVSWANQPENVQAVLQQRKDDAEKKAAEEKRKAELGKEIAAKRASLRPLAAETFQDNRLVWLQAPPADATSIKLEDHLLKLNTTLTKGQNAGAYRILGKELLHDFVAELEVSIHGGVAYAGVTWTDGGDKKYQAAYSSPSYLFVEAAENDHFGLGGMLTSQTEQKIRVERLAESLTVSVNGKPLYEGTVAPQPARVGLYLGHGGGVQGPASVSITVKSFKVWTPGP